MIWECKRTSDGLQEISETLISIIVLVMGAESCVGALHPTMSTPSLGASTRPRLNYQGSRGSRT